MSLLEKIKAAKAEKQLLGDRPDVHKITTADISLRGTGLTKRVIERDAAAYAKETSKALTSNQSAAVAATEKQFVEGIEATLEAMRKENEKSVLKWDDSQLKAIAGIKHNKVSCLIGAAGTGKTTVTKKVTEELAKVVRVVNISETLFVQCESENGNKFRCLLKDARLQGYKILDDWANKQSDELPGIAFAAFTGRASQQIKRAIPEAWHKNISTIHSLLGYAPVFEDMDYIDPISGQAATKQVKRFRPSFDHTCQLPYTIYVLDEASMVPIPLWNEFIDAIHETSRILIIGDIHQLPPPYGKGVLGYAMKKWPVFELTHIHRQAAGNAIISNAHKVLHGKPLENAENFHMIGNSARAGKLSPTGQGELQGYFLGIIKQLSQLKKPDGSVCYDPYKDNIIVPGNGKDGKNLVGQIPLNERLVTMFNPEVKEQGIIVNKRMKIHTGNNHVYFALRDKVMITKNINQVDPPITNGMMGIVESINLNGKYDQKRSQIEDTDDEEFGGEIELDLDMDNMAAALGKSLGGDNEEKENKDDASGDQRQSSHVMAIRFENGQSFECSTAGDYRAVTHGYATTCHKAQGGEYPNVIILCHSVNSVMLTQEWLYTAITRARNNVYLVCNQRGLDQALKRQTIKGFTLEEKIKSYALANDIEDSDDFDVMKHPILWKPKEI